MGEVVDFNDFRRRRNLAAIDAQEMDPALRRHPINRGRKLRDLAGNERHIERALDTVDDWLIQGFYTLPLVEESKEKQESIGSSLESFHRVLVDKNTGMSTAEKYRLSAKSHSSFHVLFEVDEDDPEAKTEVMKLSYAKQMTIRALTTLLERQEILKRPQLPRRYYEFDDWLHQITQRAHQLRHTQYGMHSDTHAADRIDDISSRQAPADYYLSIRPNRYIAHQSRELCLRYVREQTNALGLDGDESHLRDEMIDSASRNTVTRIHKQADDDFVIAGLIESTLFAEPERAGFEQEWL